MNLEKHKILFNLFKDNKFILHTLIKKKRGYTELYEKRYPCHTSIYEFSYLTEYIFSVLECGFSHYQ